MFTLVLDPAFKIYAWVRCQRVLMNGVPTELDSNQSCRNSLCFNDFLWVSLTLSESSRKKLWTKMIKHSQIFQNSVSHSTETRKERRWLLSSTSSFENSWSNCNCTAMFSLTLPNISESSSASNLGATKFDMPG